MSEDTGFRVVADRPAKVRGGRYHPPAPWLGPLRETATNGGCIVFPLTKFKQTMYAQQVASRYIKRLGWSYSTHSRVLPDGVYLWLEPKP